MASRWGDRRLDTDRSVAQQFGVLAIPRTIVIGRDGKVAADTYPMLLQAEHLEEALAGEPIGIGPPMRDLSAEPMDEADDEVILSVVMRRCETTDGPMMVMMNDGNVTFSNANARTILDNVVGNQFRGQRVLTEATLPEEDERFDLIVKIPGGDRDATISLVREAVCQGLDLTATTKERVVEVYVLVAVEGADEAIPATVAGSHTLLADQRGSEQIIRDPQATTTGSVCRTLEAGARPPDL